MSEQATIVTGTVDNGTTVQIEVKGYSGPAALRSRGERVEIAYLGREPRSVPIPVMIDGQPYRVTEKLKSLVKDMTLLVAVAEPIA